MNPTEEYCLKINIGKLTSKISHYIVSLLLTLQTQKPTDSGVAESRTVW